MTSQPLFDHLDTLSAALDGGVDLGAVLSVLVDDLVTHSPSFLGLQLAVSLPASGTVTLSTLDSAGAGSVRASLMLRLDLIGLAAAGTTIVFYDARPGAFDSLAATTRDEYPWEESSVVLDGHLDPTDATKGLAGLTELDAVNQAVGVLLHHGHTPDEARTLITRRAIRFGESLEQAALALIESPPPP